MGKVQELDHRYIQYRIKFNYLKASKPDKFPVGGLIIHSGFKSALSVIKEDMKQIPKQDFFVNIKNIETVICKILILHGINDTQIGIR